LSYNDKPPYNRELEQFNQYANQVYRWIFGNRGFAYLLIFIILLLMWLASGVYIIQPGEEGVEQTFGRFSSISTAGLNYHIPWPIQRVNIVDVESIRRVEIGFRTTAPDLKQEILSEALMLTADENIVQVELLLQYRIGNSRDFVFNVQGPEQVLRTAAEVSLRTTVGQSTIDAVITEERGRVQDDTRERLDDLLDTYQIGILVTDVRLQVADPPVEVRDAFQEVVRALADRERLINEAEAYENNSVPRARGEKQRLIEEANAFKEEQVLQATGDTQRFLSVLAAYREAPDVTRERLHIEALEQILSKVELILLDDTIGGDTLPFLPLTDPGGSNTTPAPESDPTLPPSPAETQPSTEQGGE